MTDEKNIPPNTVIGAWKTSNLPERGGQGGMWAAKPVKVKHTPQRALKVLAYRARASADPATGCDFPGAASRSVPSAWTCRGPAGSRDANDAG